MSTLLPLISVMSAIYKILPLSKSYAFKTFNTQAFIFNLRASVKCIMNQLSGQWQLQIYVKVVTGPP